MTVREVLKLLHEDGWREVDGRTKGSTSNSNTPRSQEKSQCQPTGATYHLVPSIV